MRVRILVLAIAALMLPGSALADDPVSPREHAAVAWAIGAHGCKGGKVEFDRDDHRYEVDDARCPDGNEYDFELDPWFRIIKKERD